MTARIRPSRCTSCRSTIAARSRRRCSAGRARSTPSRPREIAAAKQVIYDGFKAAVAGGVPKAKAGILVDEQFGAAILRDAAAQGFITACPAEKSGQEEFDFEYGDDFAAHIEAFHPTFCKVLVRYNPEGDARSTSGRPRASSGCRTTCTRQAAAASCSSCWCRPKRRNSTASAATRRPTTSTLRPRLMVQAIEELQDAGVEPDVWKIEGSTGARIARRSSPRRGAAAATSVGCIVLGRGEDDARSASGWRSRPACRASSASPSAAPISGSRSSAGAQES